VSDFVPYHPRVLALSEMVEDGETGPIIPEAALRRWRMSLAAEPACALEAIIDDLHALTIVFRARLGAPATKLCAQLSAVRQQFGASGSSALEDGSKRMRMRAQLGFA
jgi:hypothetical protein